MQNKKEIVSSKYRFIPLSLFLIMIVAAISFIGLAEPVQADSVDLYWVGGAGDWSQTAHWSTTDGGTGGHAVPTSTNNVYFTANSFSVGGQVVTLGDGVTDNCKNLSFVGAGAKTPIIKAGPSTSLTLNIYGSLTSEAGVTLDWRTYYGSFSLYFKATGTITGVVITSDYSYPSYLYPSTTYCDVGSGNHLTLGCDFAIGNLTINSGDIQTNTHTLTVSGTLTSAGMTYGDTVVLQNVPQTASSNGFNAGAITGANTFNNLTMQNAWGSNGEMVRIGGNQTVNGTFTANGVASNLRLAITSLSGVARTITAATVVSNHTDYSYITGAGAGNWNLAANDSIDYTNNTGITFTWPYNANEDMYWTGKALGVGGSGNWQDKGNAGINNFTNGDFNWSNTSGGIGGMPRHYSPTSNNNVFFDSHSGFTVGNQTVTWGPGSDGFYTNVKTMDFTGSDVVAPVIFNDVSGNYYPRMAVYGDLTLTHGLTFTNWGDSFELRGSGTHTFTTAGANLYSPYWHLNAAGGTYIIKGDVINPSSWTWDAGTIDTTTWSSTFYMGNGAVQVGAFSGGPLQTYYRLIYLTRGTGDTFQISGTCTFGTLSIAGGNSFTETVTFGNDIVVNTALIWTGFNGSHRLQVKSSVTGTQRQITVNGSVSVTNCDISDSAAVGTGSKDISSGNNSDLGDNLGWIFTLGAYEYWVGNSGNWSDITHWASTSGGPGGSGRIPLIQDIAKFDPNSFSIPGRTVTIDITNLGGIDTSTVTNNPTITKSGTVNMYGGINMGSAGGSVYTVTSTYLMGSNTIPITASGVYTFTTSLYVQTNPAYMTSVNFNSNFTVAGKIYLVSGTLCLQGFNVIAQDFDSTTTTYARALNLSTGTLTLNDGGAVTKFAVATTSFNLYQGTSTIVLTNSTANAQTFNGAGLTYNNLTIAGAGNYALTMQGNNTFNTFYIDRSQAAKTVKFTNSSNTTVTSFQAPVAGATVITLTNISSNNIWTLTQTSGTVSTDYLSIQYGIATGGATFYAGTHSTILDGTITNGTGVMAGSPVNLYEGGANTPTVTTVGTFTVLLGSSTISGTATSGSAVLVTGSPKALTSGSNTITTTGTPPGTISISVSGSGWLLSAPVAPVITTVAVSQITDTTATLNSNLTALGGYGTVYVYFHYGVDPTMTAYSSTSPMSLKTSPGTYGVAVTGLSKGTTYYFQAIASDGLNDLAGGYVLSFLGGNTLASVTALTPTGVANNGMTLQGSLTAIGGSTVTYEGFVWDVSSHGDPGNSQRAKTSYNGYCTIAGNFASAGNFSYLVGTLSPNTTYYIRALAFNSMGWVYSAEITQITSNAAPIPTTYKAVYSGPNLAPTATPSAYNPISMTAVMPSQFYTEGDTSGIPGAGIITAIFGQSDTPESLWWFPFIYGFIAIVSLLFYELTTSKGQVEGSLLTQFVVIEAMLVFFGVLGTAGVSGMIPLFGAFIFPIPAVAIIMSKKHYGWG